MKNRNMQDYIPWDGPSFNDFSHGGDIFITDFSDRDLIKFIKDITQAENDSSVQELIVWISSYGGDVHNAFAMVDVLQASSKPYIIAVVGKAMSAGALLAAAGGKGNRYITPNSYIMVHEVSSGIHGKTQDIIQHSQDTKRVNDQMIEAFGRFTGKGKKFWESMFYQENRNTDIYFSAQEAVKAGLVDHIGIPKRISANQKMIGVFGPQLPENKGKKKKVKNP